MVAAAVIVMSGIRAPISGTSVWVVWLTTTVTVDPELVVVTRSGRNVTDPFAEPSA
ncbi:MAG: hypothetical protein QOE09_1131, partial [Ilumatobacteraceae bacterium]